MSPQRNLVSQFRGHRRRLESCDYVCSAFDNRGRLVLDLVLPIEG